MPEKMLTTLPKATPTEILNLAARIETMAEAFEKYGNTRQFMNSAANQLRSAVGHAILEIQSEETIVEAGEIEE